MSSVALPALALSDSALSRLREGVLRLDVRGHVRSLNTAARPWLRGCIDQAKRLASLAAAAKRGDVLLPVRLNLFDNCPSCPKSPSDTWLDHDGRDGYVLLIVPVEVAPVIQAGSAKDAMLLLDGEALEEMRRLKTQLLCFAVADATQGNATQGNATPVDATPVGATPCDSPPAEAPLSELKQHAAELSAILGEVRDLAYLNQRDLAFTDERFALGTMLADILPELQAQTGTASIRYEEGSDIGQVYGHRSWLRQAILTLIGRMREGCPPSNYVNIALRQLGDFVVVTGKVNIDRNKQSGVAAMASARTSGAGFGLRMQVCQRIVELHGGSLKIEYGAPPMIYSFTMTLATGLPAHERSRASCADCRYTLQALEFGRDLADLIAAPHLSGAPQPEKPQS